MNFDTGAGLVVIDTNIVRILTDGRDVSARRFYVERIGDREVAISFVTEFEVLHGMEQAGWSASRRGEALSAMLRYRRLDGDSRIVQAAVELMALCKHQPPSFPDLFIASTAYAYQCPLVTDDRRLVEQLSAAGFEDVITRHAAGLGG